MTYAGSWQQPLQSQTGRQSVLRANPVGRTSRTAWNTRLQYSMQAGNKSFNRLVPSIVLHGLVLSEHLPKCPQATTKCRMDPRVEFYCSCPPMTATSGHSLRVTPCEGQGRGVELLLAQNPEVMEVEVSFIS